MIVPQTHNFEVRSLDTKLSLESGKQVGMQVGGFASVAKDHVHPVHEDTRRAPVLGMAGCTCKHKIVALSVPFGARGSSRKFECGMTGADGEWWGEIEDEFQDSDSAITVAFQVTPEPSQAHSLLTSVDWAADKGRIGTISMTCGIR